MIYQYNKELQAYGRRPFSLSNMQTTALFDGILVFALKATAASAITINLIATILGAVA